MSLRYTAKEETSALTVARGVVLTIYMKTLVLQCQCDVKKSSSTKGVHLEVLRYTRTSPLDKACPGLHMYFFQL